MLGLLGPLISAGSSLLGGILGQNNQDKINQQNIQAQQDFAQHGISWKVADAKAAGINPLAALGAQTSSFSNVAGDNSFGTGVAAAGQNIGRAMQAAQDPESQQIARAKSWADLESLQLDNEVKRSQLASSHALATQAGQPAGIPGQSWGVTAPSIGGVGIGDNPFVKLMPNEIHGSDPATPGVEAGAGPLVRLKRAPDGGFFKTVADTNITFDPWAMSGFNFGQRVVPAFGGESIGGHKYRYNIFNNELYPSRTGYPDLDAMYDTMDKHGSSKYGQYFYPFY